MFKFKAKPKKFISLLKTYPWKDSALSLRYLPQVFSRLEKVSLILLFGMVVILTGYIGYRSWLRTTKVMPESGGVFREGIVGEVKDLDKHIGRLTNAGLTKYDSEKNIVGDLAQNWEITENGKVYVFHLRPQFNAEDLASQILSKGLWRDIEISTPEPATITFRFKQPFSPFLYSSTKPIFNSGPYRISRESKTEIELSAREDFYPGKPYLDKVVLKFYRGKDELLKAAKRGDIDAFCLETDEPAEKNFKKLEMKLPRELVIFLIFLKSP